MKGSDENCILRTCRWPYDTLGKTNTSHSYEKFILRLGSFVRERGGLRYFTFKVAYLIALASCVQRKGRPKVDLDFSKCLERASSYLGLTRDSLRRFYDDVHVYRHDNCS